jgi:hypothetical protein
VVFALAALFTNQNGKELWKGIVYSEGLEQALFLLLRLCFLGLVALTSLYRFGRGAAFRALAILLSPLKILGLSGVNAARVVYRTLGLIPSILPRLARMIRRGIVDAGEIFARAAQPSAPLHRFAPCGLRGASPLRRKVHFALQAGICALWLLFALF